MRPLALAAAAAVGLGLAGCDGRDYEAELAAVRSDLEAATAENQALATQMQQLRAQYQETQAIPGSLEDVRSELTAMVETGSRNLAQLAELENQPGAQDAAYAQALQAIRTDLQAMMRSLQNVAQHLGIQVREAAMENLPAGEATAGEAAPAGEAAQ